MLTKHLLRKGFEFKELEAAGLSKQGKRGPIDRFMRRLLWPIRGSAGEVIGFGARRLFDDDTMTAKYVNTPETTLYKKSNVLFGIDLAKRDIAKGHQANMVEGGKTPVQDSGELGRRGFRIVIFPGGTARAVAHTLQDYYASLHRDQTTAPWQGRMLDFDGLNRLIGTPELLETGRRYENPH